MIKQIKLSAGIIILVNAIIILLSYFEILSKSQVKSLIFACIISIINYIIFLFLFNKSIKKENKKFIEINLGGMVLRILLMLALIFLTLKFLKVDKYEFIFAFLIWYILLLIFEINIVRLEKTAKNSIK
ncbi:MAG: ATP synthase subunit I [Melioribacteraceae bacterium]